MEQEKLQRRYEEIKNFSKWLKEAGWLGPEKKRLRGNMIYQKY